MTVRMVLLTLCVFAAGCNGPVVLLPGGRLAGEVRPVPKDWSFAGAYGTAQLETRPQDPYSVNIAYTILDGEPLINAGDTETRWVKNIAADPRVKLRVDGVIYEMRADRVHSRAEVERFAKAWTSQSMFRRDPSDLDPVWIYRLVPRGTDGSG
ncbi:MAG: nitroreductase/quinone reductase family protein [Myxococcota bacterium]|nr:nitroreductase/quinone reductase family protein [Myxococcota bacterium]